MGGGFAPAPVARGSGSAEVPVIRPPVAAAYRTTARNVTQSLSAPPKTGDAARRNHRRIRYRRLYTARKILPETKMGVCMRFLNAPVEGGAVVVRDDVASYHGVWRCNYRSCPFCGAWLAQRDTARAEKFARGWVKRGNAIAMVHYTLRHTREEATAAVWDAQTKVLQSCHSGRPWRAFVEEFGLLECFYGNEVTLGDNGSHKHQHRCWEIKWREELKKVRGRRAFSRRMQAAYELLYMAALAKHGRDALPGIALQLSIATPTMDNAAKAAEYVTKFTKEVTQGGMKSGHKGNQSHYALLDDAANKKLSDAERARARARFAEFHYGTHRKHWTFFSEAALDQKVDGIGEQEIPPQEEDKGKKVLYFTGDEYRKLSKMHCESRLLAMVELKGPESAREWLTRFAASWRWSRQFEHERSPAPPPRFGDLLPMAEGF